MSEIEGLTFAQANDCSYFETSALDGTNVTESFTQLMESRVKC